jgi:hypothetical protein
MLDLSIIRNVVAVHRLSFSRALEALTASIGDAETSNEWKYHSTWFYEFNEPDENGA